MISKKIYLLLIFCAALTSCVDFNDTTEPVTTTIQLQRPESFLSTADLSGLMVTIQSSEETITGITDAAGQVVFSDLAPGVYNISTSIHINSEQYKKYTGEEIDPREEYVITGSLNQQALANSTSLQLPMKLSRKVNLIISKMYTSTSKIDGGSYRIGWYIELYNNSDEAVDAAGLYIGLLESESTVAYQQYPEEQAVTPDSIYLKQLFRIPESSPVMVEPGKTLLIVNSAIDHSSQNEFERDLRGADFEAKDLTGKVPNNTDVPALELHYTAYKSISNMNLAAGGPCSVVNFRTAEDVATWPTVYADGKTKGNMFLRMHIKHVLDGVDFIKNKAQTGPDINSKRLPVSIDASYTSVSTASGNIGERLVRKTLSVTADGRKVLQDTNNSLNDFLCNDNINPREYLEP